MMYESIQEAESTEPENFDTVLEHFISMTANFSDPRRKTEVQYKIIFVLSINSYASCT